MFPQSFSARVGERMAIWGAMLAFLLCLYAVTEIIQSRQHAAIAADRTRATAAVITHVSGADAIDQVQVKKLVGAIGAIDARQMSFAANHRQNEMLLLLLILFVVGQILVLEYRWLIKPIVRIALVLGRDSASPALLAP
jgi:hypothetical protein